MNNQTASAKMLAKPIMTALFAALTAAGCFISVPLPGGVPVVIQDMMALVSGMILGPLYGGLAVALFLVLGCIGLPVFSGKAGIQIILNGPTGGFLIGYGIGAISGGLFLWATLRPAAKPAAPQWLQWVLIAAAGLLANIMLFTFGLAGFMRVTGSGLGKAVSLALVPFIPGNLIKQVVMALLVKKFRPIVHNYID
ncbi:MAG: biotin transporter BioY [Treponema sp.]|nr:biotin transporter BioY [Treponema sp.]